MAIKGNQEMMVQFRLKLLHQSYETVIKYDWLRMTRMELGLTTKKNKGDVFKFLPCFLKKIASN